jgi:excisionase family DNA binding protein
MVSLEQLRRPLVMDEPMQEVQTSSRRPTSALGDRDVPTTRQPALAEHAVPAQGRRPEGIGMISETREEPDHGTADEREADAVAEAGQLLTVAEVAAMWRVSKMTIYRMIQAGRVPAIRVGRSYRIPANVASTIGRQA